MKNNLTNEDIKEWIVDVIVFNLTPVALVFLVTLQSGNFSTAIGAAYAALIAALINLVQKYKSGVKQPTDVPVHTPSVPPVQPDVQQNTEPTNG